MIVGVQVRLGSSRLPGKALLHFSGYPLCEYIYREIEQQFADVYMLVPKNDLDLIKFCTSIPSDRFIVGDEDNVFNRYYNLALKTPGDWLLRVTGDNPFVNFKKVRELVDLLDLDDYQKVFTTRQYKDGIVFSGHSKGKNFDIISSRHIIECHDKITDPFDKEHVVPWFICNSKKLNLIETSGQERVFSIDTLEDYRKALNEYYG